MEKVNLVILGATPSEIAPIAAFATRIRNAAGAGPRIETPGSTPPILSEAGMTGLARDKRDVKFTGNTFSTYIYGNLKLLVGTTGLGKVNAAAITAAVLSNFEVEEVWNAGCSGAYAGSGLEIGDVLIADNCICADEGILEKGGPKPTSGLGIPLAVKDGRGFYDFFPLEKYLCRRKIRALLPAGTFTRSPSGGLRVVDKGVPAGTDARFKVVYGPSLTVGMASGDIETAGERFRHFGAFAENMEGSAIAQTCLLFDVPFLEFRGVSNQAGVREKAAWDLGTAIANCFAAIIHIIQSTVADGQWWPVDSGRKTDD